MKGVSQNLTISFFSLTLTYLSEYVNKINVNFYYEILCFTFLHFNAKCSIINMSLHLTLKFFLSFIFLILKDLPPH